MSEHEGAEKENASASSKSSERHARRPRFRCPSKRVAIGPEEADRSWTARGSVAERVGMEAMRSESQNVFQ